MEMEVGMPVTSVGEGLLTSKVHKGTLWVMKMFYILIWAVVNLTHNMEKNHWAVYLRFVHFTVGKL